MSFVPCLTWVRRGAAKAQPEKAEITQEELERIIRETSENMGNMDLEDIENMSEPEEGSVAAAEPSGKKKRSAATAKLDEKEDLTGLEEYGLEHYDDDDVGDGEGWGGLPGVSYYASNSEDPYITLKNENDDSDDEDNVIKPTDNLLVIGKADQELSRIEVNIYNEQEGSMFVHHDFMLPAFPLAIEWLNYPCGQQTGGNYVAIGTMMPTIDIWNLDLLDSLEPVVRLGSKPKKAKSKKSAATSSCHSDAVLDLSWNTISKNELASGSADFTIGIWDLDQHVMKTCIKHHTEKVQTLQWHPFEAQSLLSGSFDNTARVFDCRSPNTAHKVWKVNGEVERVAWNHFSPFHFMTSTDQGMVYYYDARVDNKPVFSLQAHTEAVSGLTFSSQIPGLLVTTSADKCMKVWDIHQDRPELVLDKNLAYLGDLVCCACCPDSPYTFAIGGEQDKKVWNLSQNAKVKAHFKDRKPIINTPPESTSQDNTVNENPEVAKSNIDEQEVIQGASKTVTSGTRTKAKKKKKKPKNTKQ